MANGQDELDKVGCEYGRMLGKDVANLKDDMAEIKKGQDEIKKAVNRIEIKLAQGEWWTRVGSAWISVIVSLATSTFNPWRRS